MSGEKPSTYCECTPLGETTFGEDRDLRPSTAIIKAVAAVEGVQPTDLDPLHGTVDPEAVDQLFPSHDGGESTSQILLRFSFDGWNVFVRGDGVIRVCDPDRPTDPAPVFQKPIGD